MSTLSATRALLRLSRPSAVRPRTFPLPSIPAPAVRSFHATSSTMTVHELKTKAEFSEAIKEHKVVIIDASATWCGPCKAISPFFHKLSENPDFASVYFTKFDVDEVPDIAQELGIRAMPTFAVFVDGEQKDTLMGGHPPKLQELVTKYASA